jgi:preprotein translocase subunit SecB
MRAKSLSHHLIGVSQMTEKTLPEFQIQRLYIKDLSFESPKSPKIFLEDWQPEVNLDLNTQQTEIEENLHEIVLSANVTVKTKTDIAFIVEIKQAGIFTIKNFPEEQKQQLYYSYCPSILFPYAREAVSDIVTRGGFPQLLLSPINFDALYQQQLEQAQDAVKV